jgi:Asp-tRNA(Asn)/Glu-tRNA(Gln) amidotransferase A subunit family amidase
LRTNPYSTTLPHGEISNRRVIIGMSGRNDAETLKREIDRQEQLLREYVETSTKQIEAYNDKLGALLGEAVASRRQQLASLEDLKNRI